jgi:hypothetical protein
MPLAIAVNGGVIVIISAKLDGKFGEGDPLRLLGVTLGFFYFPDETGLHTHTSSNLERHWLFTARCLFFAHLGIRFNAFMAILFYRFLADMSRKICLPRFTCAFLSDTSPE